MRIHSPARLAGLALLWVASAQAQSVTVINPMAVGEGAVSVAAGLAAAIDGALVRAPRLRRVGEALLPGELRMVFGCVDYDRACAREAARTAGAELALFAEVRRVGPRFAIDLAFIQVADGRTAREVRRLLRQRGDPADLSGGVDLALRMLVAQLFGLEPPLAEAALVLPGAVGATADGRRFSPRSATPVAPGPLSLRFESGARADVVVAPDEVLVLAPPALPPPRGASPLRMAAWMTAGGSLVALGGAAYFGLDLAQTQTDYRRVQDPDLLQSHREHGAGAADAATALLITGGVAALVAAALFMLDD